jgi:hypothetical protein
MLLEGEVLTAAQITDEDFLENEAEALVENGAETEVTTDEVVDEADVAAQPAEAAQVTTEELFV